MKNTLQKTLSFSFLFLIYTFLLLNSLCVTIAFCQDSKLEITENLDSTIELEKKDDSSELASIEKQKSTKKVIKNLKTLQISIQKLKKDREELQVKMQSTEGRGRETYFIDEIKTISKKITSLEADYVELATGVKIVKTSEDDVEKKDLVKELTELLKPLLGELKELTSRPRKIDFLKTQQTQLSEEVGLLKKGINSLDSLIEASEADSLDKSLLGLQENWRNELSIKNTKLRVVKDKLNELISNQKTVFETVSDVTNIFFKSRGRNLLFAIFSAIFFWFLFSSWRKKLEAKWIKKGLNSKRRVVIVLLDITSFLGSFIIFVFILFAIGDWVLVVLTVLLALGLLWAIKNTIPRYWEQTVLLLNVGPVREGHRVTYRGVTWRVKRLHFQSALENPLLSDGYLRLPIKDLIEMRSWPESGREPWFPSKKGDWVVLDNETFGQVEIQSIEVVVLKLKGGSTKSIATSSYLDSMPINLSEGFRINSTVGLDYELRKKAASDIPSKLLEGIKRKLVQKKYKESDFKINVEFELMDSSSLNFAVIVDFNGSLASEYQVLKRLIQKLALEVCNEQKYGIPFPQMDVHLDKLN